MQSAPFVDDDSLDPGLKAAFAAPEEPAAGDSVFAVLRACGAVQKCVYLRQEIWEEPELQRQAEAAENMPKRYHVTGELARGGVGVVLKGHDIDLGREVALKTLRTEHAGNASLTRRLVEEAQIGGQLQHPGILPVYELGLDSSKRPFFAMKLVRGRTLAQILKERKSPQEDQPKLLGIFEQLCHAMAYAHARGVIHRDLKPANIMVGKFGETQVVDWGLAKVLPKHGTANDGSANDDTWDMAPKEKQYSPIQAAVTPALSEAGSVIGTPAYMPPEQASGDIERLDERSDVFGLGAILCEILTGAPPYEGARLEVLDQAREGRTEKAIERLKKCGASTELVELTQRCLKADRQERPRDAGEVVCVVEAHRNSVELRARTAEIEAARANAKAIAEVRVRKLTAVFAGILVVVTALGAGVFGLYTNQRRKAAESQLVADRAKLDLEREQRARLEGTLEVLVPLNGKARFMVVQAANMADRDLDRWIELMGMLREVASRTAENAPTKEVRSQAQAIVEELRSAEKGLRERLAKAESESSRE